MKLLVLTQDPSKVSPDPHVQDQICHTPTIPFGYGMGDCFS